MQTLEGQTRRPRHGGGSRARLVVARSWGWTCRVKGSTVDAGPLLAAAVRLSRAGLGGQDRPNLTGRFVQKRQNAARCSARPDLGVWRGKSVDHRALGHYQQSNKDVTMRIGARHPLTARSLSALGLIALLACFVAFGTSSVVAGAATTTSHTAKSLTRVQKLSRALKACKKQPRRRRAACVKGPRGSTRLHPAAPTSPTGAHGSSHATDRSGVASRWPSRPRQAHGRADPAVGLRTPHQLRHSELYGSRTRRRAPRDRASHRQAEATTCRATPGSSRCW